MTTPAPFPRQRQLPWRDARLWAGLALVLVSTLAGALVLGRDDGAVQVWRATRDLAPGALPEAEPVRVVIDGDASAYVPASEPLSGHVVTPVAAGALIPASALRADPGPGVRRVTVPISAAHAPIGLAPGDRVDVWSSPGDAPGGAAPGSALGTAPPAPALVLASVTVRAVAADALGLGGELPVALEVEQREAGLLVAAMRTGVVDLVAVPFDDPS